MKGKQLKKTRTIYKACKRMENTFRKDCVKNQVCKIKLLHKNMFHFLLRTTHQFLGTLKKVKKFYFY
jgi:hypothetical protein